MEHTRTVLCKHLGKEQQARLSTAIDEVWQRLTPSQYEPNPFEVAALLKTLNADCESLIACLLSARQLESLRDYSTVAIEQRYNRRVALLVKSIRWLNAFRDDEHLGADGPPEQAERLRRMLLTVVDDVRAVLVKLALELRRMQDLSGYRAEQRVFIARQVMTLYAPLANRLGIGQLKWEMEDLAFREIEPLAYKRVAKSLEERRTDRENYVARFVEDLSRALTEQVFSDFNVFGRPKHIYSIWRKMKRKHIEFEELYDVRAVRVLLPEVKDCYAALGVVHGLWQPIPSEFDDYIANPKKNGYQSLHTAVLGPSGKAVEVQLRTYAMDEDAELGVAAHWRYKEGDEAGKRDPMQRGINALRALLESNNADDTFADEINTEMLSDRVFVFTPKGDVIDLPVKATPLDFAYAVHTEVGHRCRGAKVNGEIVPLNHALDNGDKVEVLTSNRQRPSRDWLNRGLGYLRSSRARAKVRHWFNVLDREQQIGEGKDILHKELKRLGATHISIEKLANHLRFERLTELYVGLARNEVTSTHLATALYQLDPPIQEDELRTAEPRKPQKQERDSISVRGVGNLMTQMAGCCTPVPYDSIIGYITRGRGVMVHRRDCQNVLNMRDEDQERLIEVDWGEEQQSRYSVSLRVFAYDRQGLLRDISLTMANENVNVTGVHTQSNRIEQTADMRLNIEISDIEQLTRLMQKLRQLPNVIDVGRSG